MMQTTLYDALFDAITPQTTILTPNRRLAATLHKLYEARLANQGCHSWLTPDILPATSWFQRLWQDYISLTTERAPLILNITQEKFIWEQIITQSKRYETLLRTSETGDKVCAAYGLLKQWRITLTDSNIANLFHSTEDYAALYDWIMAFEKRATTHHYTSLANLPDLLMPLISDKKIPLPKAILLAGFTDIAPQLKHFLKICEQLDTHTESIALHSAQASISRVSTLDNETEIRTMAQWAKEQHKASPSARIACVIPTIESMRDRVQQLFAETFAKEGELQADAASFNITAGKPLQHYPIIHTALTLLGLYKKNASLDTLTQILCTPFIGEAESERLKRAKYDRRLRQTNISKLNLRRLIEDNEDNALQLKTYCPQLAKRLQTFFTLLKNADKTLPMHAWAALFTQLLTALGWPGERSINSEEFQIVDSWLTLLDTYTSLGVVSEELTYSKALQTLTKLCASTVFQAKTPDAPIQVMGLLEAASLPFDHIWVAGMDDISWPPQPHPNPFIPKRLQREWQMPHATPERELLFCNTLMQQFAHCTPHLIYSYTEKRDELACQASALIRAFPEITVDQLHLANEKTISEKIYDSRNLEYLQDEMAPPIADIATVLGGIHVIQHQALCPFRAFAHWRLHAQALETPVPGLRAKDRGIIIHKIMELIWNQLQNHEALNALSADELHHLIQVHVETALLSLPPSHRDFKRYLALEKKRLITLIKGWLENEKTRDPFHVLTHEKRIELTLNKLTLSFRIDRIDELENGKQFIIDYKTGKHNDINAWFGDRPEQPQLPLYTLVKPDETAGIAFAQICAGEHGFKGVSRYAMTLKGIKLITEVRQTNILSWNEQIQTWRDTLSKLSNDFSMGIAYVDPKEDEKTCEWCVLKSLCRVSEELCH